MPESLWTTYTQSIYKGHPCNSPYEVLHTILEKKRSLTKVKLYNRNDCCPERLTGIKIYLGNSWDSYNANSMVSVRGWPL